MTQPTLVNSHPNEYSQWLSYYPFAVNLDRFREVAILLMIYQIVCTPKKTRIKFTCF